MAVCSVRAVATSQKKNDQGEWKDDKTFWAKITGFGKQAENMAESFVKGDLVLVVGKVQTEEWEDGEGNKRSSTAILVDHIGHSTKWNASTSVKTERVQSGGGGTPATSPADDPWATGGGSTPQTDEPPF